MADFNDDDASAYPGAPEDCTDGIDNDGNDLVDANDPNAVGCDDVCTDMDVDGYSIEGGSCGPIDCDDNNADINPGAVEICDDGIDNNCNGLIDTTDMNAVDCSLECTDSDHDGYAVEGGSCGAMDCDDDDADINPGEVEVCDDDIDNNCNSYVDEMDSLCQNGGDNEQPWWQCPNHDNHSSWWDHHGDSDKRHERRGRND
jgi:hypothetical protein